MKVVKIIGNIIFVFCLVTAGLFFLAHFTKVLPLRVFIVSSGSMEPAIKTGSLVVTLPSSAYQIGDIVTYKTGKKDTTTHRLVAADAGQYKTAGDANKAPDTSVVTGEQILGRVIYSLPQAGYLAAFAKTPPGFILFVIIPATIIVYEELKSLLSQVKKIRLPKNTPLFQFPSPKLGEGSRVEYPIKAAFVILPLFMAAFILVTVKSISYFSDTETSSNNSFTAFVTTPTPSPTPQLADHVVIGEVQINGSNANEDFVEIYNPTDSSVDLNGWQINKKTSTGTVSSLVLFGSGASIPAHGYFLWANNQGNPSFSSTIGADVSNTNNLSENNSIALENASDVIIDQVGWGTGTDQFVETTLINNGSDTNKSMERKAYTTSTQATMEGGVDALKGNGFDANDNATDFILRLISQPQNSASATETP